MPYVPNQNRSEGPIDFGGRKSIGEDPIRRADPEAPQVHRKTQKLGMDTISLKTYGMSADDVIAIMFGC